MTFEQELWLCRFEKWEFLLAPTFSLETQRNGKKLRSLKLVGVNDLLEKQPDPSLCSTAASRLFTCCLMFPNVFVRAKDFLSFALFAW